MAEVPHFDIPLDLPHAGTIALRVQSQLRRLQAPLEVLELSRQLVELLDPHRDAGENPPAAEAAAVVLEAARLGREIVARVEAGRATGDRLGQAIRNLFECLALGAEGAVLSLRAGENPGSALRPT